MGTNSDGQRQQDETDQSGSDGTGRQSGAQGDQRADGSAGGTGLVDWVTETFLRAVVAIFGLLLLLFALGQIAGVDMLGALADLLATEVVQWTLVAVFALLLIVAASKSWNIHTSN